MSDARTRLLAYGGLQVAALAVVAGMLSGVTFFTSIETEYSGLAPTLATWFVQGTILLVLALYIGIPLRMATFWRDDDDPARRGLSPLTWAGIAVLTVPALAVAIVSFLLSDGVSLPLVASIAVLAVIGGLLGKSLRTPADRPVWPIFLNVALVVVFLLGVVASMPLAGVFADEVETYGTMGYSAEFAFDEQVTVDGERVLNVSHSGGDAIRVDHIYLRGEGFANVETADQTAPGQWAGTTTPPHNPNAVATDDYVVVGVTDECHIRVVHQREAFSITLAEYRCAG